MPIQVNCPCGARLMAPDKVAGKQVTCPHCHRVLQVPATLIQARCPICGNVTCLPIPIQSRFVQCRCGTPFDAQDQIDQAELSAFQRQERLHTIKTALFLLAAACVIVLVIYVDGSVRNKKAMETFRCNLGDTSAAVRVQAAKALGESMDTQAVEPLVSCLLKDRDPSVRSMAAEALNKLGDARAVKLLIASMKDKEFLGHPEVTEVLSKLGKMSKVSAEPFIECLKGGNEKAKACVARVLGELGDAQAVGPLIACLKDGGKDVRYRAAEALGRLGDREAVGPLIACLKDNEEDIRCCAIKALGRLRDGRAVEPICTCLGDTYEVRRTAAKALGELADRRAIPALRDVLPDWGLGSEFAKALGKLGWKPASDREQVYQWIATTDGASLKSNWSKVRPILLEDVKSSDSTKMYNAVFTIASLGREDAARDLIAILNTSGSIDMAKAFVETKYALLARAGDWWATDHGWKIFALPTTGSTGRGLKWGSW